jgi:hypothetical protein
MTTRKDKPTPRRRYRVGDKIQFPWGADMLQGLVIEDRGNLGVGGRQIVRLRTQYDAYAEPVEFELSEDHIELVEAAP